MKYFIICLQKLLVVRGVINGLDLFGIYVFVIYIKVMIFLVFFNVICIKDKYVFLYNQKVDLLIVKNLVFNLILDYLQKLLFVLYSIKK